MYEILSAELKIKLEEFKATKTTTQDGKNILLPFIGIFQEFVESLEAKFEDFQKAMTNENKLKDDHISKLEAEGIKHKKIIAKLEEQLDEQCQYTRRESLVFSGDQIPHGKSNEDCIEEVCKLASKIDPELSIAPADVSIAHRLGPKPATGPDRRSIIARFVRRNVKYSLLNRARRLKPRGIFVNESLTPMRQTIASVLRKLKKDHPAKISGYSTTDGSIYVWIKPPNPSAAGAQNTRVTMNSLSKLEIFCQKNFGKSATDFIASARMPGQNGVDASSSA